MEYIYEVYDVTKPGINSKYSRVDSCTKFIDIENLYGNVDHYAIEVFKNDQPFCWLKSTEDWESFRTMLERIAAWKPKKVNWDPFKHLGDTTTAFTAPSLTTPTRKDPINPSHHKNYLRMPDGSSFQWIEVMSMLPRFRDDPMSFKGALELQVRKYLDRQGRKDNPLQELQKALWYLKYLVAFVKNNDIPVRVKDVDTFINHKCE